MLKLLWVLGATVVRNDILPRAGDFVYRSGGGLKFDYLNLSYTSFVMAMAFFVAGFFLNFPFIIFLVYAFLGAHIVFFVMSRIAWRQEDKSPKDLITVKDLVQLFGGIWIPFTVVASPYVMYVPENPFWWYVIAFSVAFLVSMLISTSRNTGKPGYITDTQSGFLHFSLGFSVSFILATMIVWTSGYYEFDLTRIGLMEFMALDKTYLGIIGMWLFSVMVDGFSE